MSFDKNFLYYQVSLLGLLARESKLCLGHFFVCAIGISQLAASSGPSLKT